MRTFIYLFFVAQIQDFSSIPIDNGVEGGPVINCGPNEIVVTFKTRNPFQGRLYVEGNAGNEDCQNTQIGRRSTGINLLFDACNFQRLRSLNPRGIFASATVVVSFHPLFLTKIDRLYKVQCFYMEVEKQLNERLQISDLPISFVNHQVPMPTCRYEILNGHPEAERVEFGVVGQQVYHKFTCDSETSNTFCMTVYSCFVKDDRGKKVEILDAGGCANDKYLLNDLEYPSDLEAGQEAHVFMFADQQTLFFECQVNLSLKEPQTECDRPNCSNGRQKRRTKMLNSSDFVVDVSSERIRIVELLDLVERQPNYLPNSSKDSCVSTKVLITAGLFLFIFCILTSTIVYMSVRRRKFYIVQK